MGYNVHDVLKKIIVQNIIKLNNLIFKILAIFLII
jgi:hypothetical protein